MEATVSLWLTIVLSLASGLVGSLVTTWIQIRREDRRTKVETLRRFAANRFDIKGDEFSRTLNEIFVVFNASKSVIDALMAFHGAVTSGQGNQGVEDTLVKLYKAMCGDSGIGLSSANDSFFLTPFNTKATSAPPQLR